MTLPRALLDLRRTEIVRPVLSDPRTLGDLVLGVDRDTALEAIQWGQADFDKPIGTLSAEDRVLLYAYFNQPGHIEELSEAFRQMFSQARPEDPLIVVDLGCGPFTAGLALAAQLGATEQFDYIGVDRSQTMLEFGERLAAAAETMPTLPQIRRQWASDVASIPWTDPPGWRPVLVVVSFLLASRTLSVEQLLNDLKALLSTLGRGEVFVLYTNSASERANQTFPILRKMLVDTHFNTVVDDIGVVHTERRTRNLRYALFHRRAQRTLEISGD